MRAAAAVVIAILVLGPSAESASNGPPYESSNAGVSSRCEFEPAECDPVFRADSGVGRIRGDVSISTPAAGQAPGWGDVFGWGELYTTRTITVPAKVVRYIVRIKAHFLVDDQVSIGHSETNAFFHATAEMIDCLTCRITPGQYEVNNGFRGFIVLPVTITNAKGAAVPPGEVSLNVQVSAGSSICCMGVTLLYGPPFVWPTSPPGLGTITARINTLVKSIARV